MRKQPAKKPFNASRITISCTGKLWHVRLDGNSINSFTSRQTATQVAHDLIRKFSR